LLIHTTATASDGRLLHMVVPSVTFVSPLTTAQLIKLPFRWWFTLAQETIYYRWGPDLSRGRDNFGGLSLPLKSIGSLCCGVCI